MNPKLFLKMAFLLTVVQFGCSNPKNEASSCEEPPLESYPLKINNEIDARYSLSKRYCISQQTQGKYRVHDQVDDVKLSLDKEASTFSMKILVTSGETFLSNGNYTQDGSTLSLINAIDSERKNVSLEDNLNTIVFIESGFIGDGGSCLPGDILMTILTKTDQTPPSFGAIPSCSN